MSVCAICVEDSTDSACCVPCGHVYCRECIDEWVKNSVGTSDCPVCRRAITDVMTIYIKTDESKDLAVAENTELKAKLEDCTDEKNKVEKLLTTCKSRWTNVLNDHKRQTDKYQDKIKQLSNDNELMLQKIRKLKEHNAFIVEKEENLSHEISVLKKYNTNLQEQKENVLKEKQLLEKLRDDLQEQKEKLLKENKLLVKSKDALQEQVRYVEEEHANLLNEKNTSKTRFYALSIIIICSLHATVLYGKLYADNHSVHMEAAAFILSCIYVCFLSLLVLKIWNMVASEILKFIENTRIRVTECVIIFERNRMLHVQKMLVFSNKKRKKF